MKKWFRYVGTASALVGITGIAFAETESSKQKVFEAATRAFQEGVPEVAAEKFRAYLNLSLLKEEKREGSLRLAESLLAARQFSEALEVLKSFEANPEVHYFRGVAFSGMGQPEAAVEQLKLAAKTNDIVLRNKAVLAEAENLETLGRNADAILALENHLDGADVLMRLQLVDLYLHDSGIEKAVPILDAIEPGTSLEKNWTKYLHGLCLLKQGKAQQASDQFQQLSGVSMPEPFIVRSAIAQADALIALGSLGQAGDIIENAIGLYPKSNYLGRLFEKLRETYSLEKNVNLQSLQRWADEKKGDRSAYALYSLGRLELASEDKAKARKALSELVNSYPEHPLRYEALNMIGGIDLGTGDYENALAAFEKILSQKVAQEIRIEALAGASAAYFQKRDFSKAAELLQQALAESKDNGELLNYNLALCWLHMGDSDKFLEAYKSFSQHWPESPLRRGLLLEEGLLQAKNRNIQALQTLELFVRDFPDHPRVPEAQLALAELAYEFGDYTGASRYIRASNENPSQQSGTEEQAAYLAIFVAQSEGGDDEAIRKCRDFINTFSKSTHLPEVRMKLGEIYFKKGDFANARTQLELLASTNADAALNEMALFLAGQAAVKMADLDAGLELYEKVAKLDGKMKLFARQEQAIVKNLQGKEQEAIILYDNILKSNPPAELEYAALAGKGDNLQALGKDDPKFFQQAVETFEKLAAMPEVPSRWHNHALYKKGKSLEKLNKPDEALAAYYDILDKQASREQEAEYFWYYKAGFDAAHSLEAARKWNSAIGIYQKMANLAGPRSEEAKKEVTRLKLEHFLWEE